MFTTQEQAAATVSVFLNYTSISALQNLEFSSRVGTIVVTAVDQKKITGVVHDSKSIKTVVSLLCISFLVWHAQ